MGSPRDTRSLWTNFISFSCFALWGREKKMFSTSEHETEHSLTFCWDNKSTVRFLIKHNTPWTLLLAKRSLLYIMQSCFRCLYFLLVGTYRGRWTNRVEESCNCLFSFDWLTGSSCLMSCLFILLDEFPFLLFIFNMHVVFFQNKTIKIQKTPKAVCCSNIYCTAFHFTLLICFNTHPNYHPNDVFGKQTTFQPQLESNLCLNVLTKDVNERRHKPGCNGVTLITMSV